MEFVDFGRVSLINILPATAALLTNLIKNEERNPIQKFLEKQQQNGLFKLSGSLLLFVGYLAFYSQRIESTKNNSSLDYNGTDLINVSLYSLAGAMCFPFIRQLIDIIIHKEGQQSNIKEINNWYINSILVSQISIGGMFHSIEYYEGMIIGFLGAIMSFSIGFIFQRLNIEDPIQIIQASLGGGFISFICTGLFHKKEGLFYGESKIIVYQVALFIGLVLANCLVFMIDVYILKCCGQFNLSQANQKSNEIENMYIQQEKLNNPKQQNPEEIGNIKAKLYEQSEQFLVSFANNMKLIPFSFKKDDQFMRDLIQVAKNPHGTNNIKNALFSKEEIEEELKTQFHIETNLEEQTDNQENSNNIKKNNSNNDKNGENKQLNMINNNDIANINNNEQGEKENGDTPPNQIEEAPDKRKQQQQEQNSLIAQ